MSFISKLIKRISDVIESNMPYLPQTVIVCGVSYAFDFKTRFGVDVVGYIPKG